MELNKINSSGTTWGAEASALNENFGKIDSSIEQLKNSTTRNKGYFSSEAALKSAVPTAAKGDKAYVGSAYPYQIWTWNGSAWVNSGSTGGEESVRLGDYYTKETTDAKFEETDAKLSELGSEVGSEYTKITSDDFVSSDSNEWYFSDGKKGVGNARVVSQIIKVQEGDEFLYRLKNTESVLSVAAFDKNNNLLLGNSVNGLSENGTYVVGSGINFLQFYAMADSNNNVKKVGNSSNPKITDEIYLLKKKSVMSDGTLGIENVSFVYQGAYNSDGSFNENVTRLLSNFIKVEEGQEIYAFLYDNSNERIAVAAFDENLNIIVDKCVMHSVIDNGNVLYRYAVPNGVSYLRFGTMDNGGRAYVMSKDKYNKNNEVDHLKKKKDSSYNFTSTGYQASILNYFIPSGQKITVKVKSNCIWDRLIILANGSSFRIKDTNVYEEVMEFDYTPNQDFYDFGLFASVIENGKIEMSVELKDNYSKNVVDGTASLKIAESDFVNFGYVNNEGTFVLTTTRATTDFISVNKGQTISATLVQGGSGVMAIAAFDKDFNFIRNKSVDSVSGTFAYKYEVSDGIEYIRLCSMANEKAWATDVNGQNILVKKNYARLIDSFEKFENNNDWVVSDNKKSASTSVKNSLFRYKYESFEDDFNLSAKVVPNGESFLIVFGKKNISDYKASTLVGLSKDNGISCLKIYSTDNKEVYSGTLTNVSLLSGHAYWVRIEKRTNESTSFVISITDRIGNCDVFNFSGNDGGDSTNEANGSDVGYGWGCITIGLISGNSINVSDISFGYPNKTRLKLSVMGHSFIEGNSIPTKKNSRFVAKVRDKIGRERVVISGHGGIGAIGFHSYRQQDYLYSDWLRESEYVMFSLTQNDIDENPSLENQQNCIANIDEISRYFLKNGVGVIWLTNTPWKTKDFKTDDIVNQHIKNNYMYVDIEPAFRNIDGSINESAYLDHVHPTIETHEKIFRLIVAQAPYLFD